MTPRVLNISDTDSLSDYEDDIEIPNKVDGPDFQIKTELPYSRDSGDNVASSSGTNVRSSLIGMGFPPSLVDKAITEKGEEDADMLLDTLFALSGQQNISSEFSKSSRCSMDENEDNQSNLECPSTSCMEQVSQATRSSSLDSLGSLLDDDKDSDQITTSVALLPKQEIEMIEDIDDDKRVSLLRMKFSPKEVDFAISKLGKNVPIDELVDFIFAAQIAETDNGNNLPNADRVDNEDTSTEALFGTMDKTVELLKMGFNEHDVSLAIEKLGSKVAITKLANYICAYQMGESYPVEVKAYSTDDGPWYHGSGMPNLYGDGFNIKTEEPIVDDPQTMMTMSSNVTPKEEYDELDSFVTYSSIDRMKGKRPKEEYVDDYSSHYGPLRKKSKNLCNGNRLSSSKTPVDVFEAPKPTAKSLGRVVSGPPYFLYGNIINLSSDGWQKVSQFLFALEPEFVNTRCFSALNRKEGYIHNLPSEGRIHITPKSPMSIEEALPQTKKYWPSWDERKKLSSITSDTTGISTICSDVQRMLVASRGVPSAEERTKIMHYCCTMNLVWMGPQKLSPMEPECLERILGYPMHHTRNPDASLVDRLESLRDCFQTDTLGYHLSVLKPLFPGGITVLSLYSGIGGAEVALHRLGIFLKGVISVESSDVKRRILRRWWQSTDQPGELVQIEDIQKLNSSKLEYLMNKFGGFDLVICQNPCTYSPRSSKTLLGSGGVGGLDFTLYYEFVRVLQRVRTLSGRT